jgi:hypothetical protein
MSKARRKLTSEMLFGDGSIVADHWSLASSQKPAAKTLTPETIVIVLFGAWNFLN